MIFNTDLSGRMAAFMQFLLEAMRRARRATGSPEKEMTSDELTKRFVDWPHVQEMRLAVIHGAAHRPVSQAGVTITWDHERSALRFAPSDGSPPFDAFTGMIPRVSVDELTRCHVQSLAGCVRLAAAQGVAVCA